MSINSIQQNVYNSYAAKAAVKEEAAKAAETAAAKAKDSDVVVELGAEQVKSGTYANPKGLSAEGIKALKDAQAAQNAKFLQSMMQSNIKNQSQQFMKATQLNFGGVLISAEDFMLPQGGSTPEEAAKAIGEGGAYSVEAVSDRIFSLAEKIANGDSEKLAVMRDAVEKGFKQAGLSFKSSASQDLPDICHDTYDNIMDRFDKLQEKLNQPEQDQTAAE